MKKKSLIVRADASAEVGVGHVMRCAALAQAWRDDGGSVTFVMGESAPSVDEFISSQGFSRIALLPMISADDEVKQLIKIARDQGESGEEQWIVVDGYQFSSGYYRGLKNAGLRILALDDTGQCSHYFADLVLNQNLHASERMYSYRENYTRLLLGPQYALIRREFLPWSDCLPQRILRDSKLIVMMGGSDPGNFTATALQALPLVRTEGLEVTVVVGGSNPNMSSLQDVVRESPARITLKHNPPNLPEIMAHADVALSAAGSSCWELCLLGIPSILVSLAANQVPLGKELAKRKIAIYLGASDTVTPQMIAEALTELFAHRAQRKLLSLRSRDLVDGRGAEKVIAAMQTPDLRLRKANSADCQMFWEWANDPSVRAVSLRSEPIGWKNHLEWFDKKLQDDNARMFVAVDSQGCDVGQIRFDLKNSTAVLSISMASAFRGKGFGKRVLKLGTQELFRTTEVTTIDAFVKPDNLASLRLFSDAGFERGRGEILNDQPTVHFVLKKHPRKEFNPSRMVFSSVSVNPPKKPKKIRIAISQPTYLPWIGYFDLVDQVDAFVLLDDVQFVRQSWQQRNRIKTPSGLRWLTVPVKFRGLLGQLIKHVEVRDSDFWQNHLRSIELNYRRAPFFDKYYEELGAILSHSGQRLLVDLDLRLIDWLMGVLGIKTPLILSSHLNQTGKRTELLATICNLLGAREYISPVGSAVYLLGEEKVLSREGVEMLFQHYDHPEYRQMFPPFLPYASVLDLIFNEGGRSLEIIRSGRREPFPPGEVAAALQMQARAG